jgi:hypothetical protein
MFFKRQFRVGVEVSAQANEFPQARHQRLGQISGLCHHRGVTVVAG